MTVVVEPTDQEVTFDELVQEVIDRGYHYIARARIERWVNRVHRKLCRRYKWPFMEISIEGAASLEIEDLGKVLDVNDLTARENLDPIDIRRVRRMDPDLSATGTPEYWYLDGDTLCTWPASEHTLEVRYLRRAVNLSGSDSFLVPGEFLEIVVDWTETYCLKDNDDRQEARELKNDVDEAISEMFQALINRNNQRPETLERTGPPDSYLQ